MERKISISAGLLVRWNNEVLLVKNKNRFGEYFYSIPKGELVAGENLMDAAIRETYEETGVIIPKDMISGEPSVLNLEKNGRVYKRVFYFSVDLNSSKKPLVKIVDQKEISWAGFVSSEFARAEILFFQRPILYHLQKNNFDQEYLLWLLNKGYISRIKHPFLNLFLYNYTEKCKETGFWNEYTLRCRGLILDDEYQVVARPFKKFFEYHKLYENLHEYISGEYKAYEKMDGALGILYWVGEKPFIANRSSFTSIRAFKGTNILQVKYQNLIQNLQSDVTYLFEIIINENKNVIEYNYNNELILLAGISTSTGELMDRYTLEKTGFQLAAPVLSNNFNELVERNIENEEGYVVYFANGFIVKIKFPWYYNQYKEVFSTRYSPD